MPTDFNVTVRLNIPRHILWRIRASKTFMSFLVTNGALQRMDATKPKSYDPQSVDSPTSSLQDCFSTDNNNNNNNTKPPKQPLTRMQTYVPADVVIPEMIKPIIDDSYIEIRDDQTWDEATPYVQSSVIRPTILGDVIQTCALLSLNDDDTDPNFCWHSLSGKVSVAILFLGYYVEQAVVTNMKSFYDSYPRHVDDFVHMLIHKFGDGTRNSLEQAVHKMLTEEKLNTC